MLSKRTPMLFLGFGSIAKRHVRNLLSLGYRNISVSDPDDRAFVDGLPVQRVGRLTPRLAASVRIAFICTPTNHHIADALVCARAGCDVFIEKPLSLDLRGVAALRETVKRKKIVAMSACNYRFHPGFRLLESIVRNRTLGKPLTARVVIGHDISASRSGVDYRQTYAARVRGGGGVILDSGAHAVDYLQSVFGPVRSVAAQYGNLSRLELETEDYAAAVLQHASGVSVTLDLDYFSRPKRHSVEIQCERGRVFWDFPNNRIQLYDAATHRARTVRLYAKASPEKRRNDMYLREVTAFLRAVDRRTTVEGDLASAHAVLKVLLALKTAGKKKTSVNIPT